MRISLVLPIFNRDSDRLDRLLTTTDWQFAPFHEVIVVDGSDPVFADPIERACTHCAYYYHVDLTEINFPYLYNVGIKMTDFRSDHVLCTNCDMLFDPAFVLVLSKLLDGRVEFARSQSAVLPQNTSWKDFGTREHWKYLLGFATRRFELGHGLLCAPRDWWFRVHGFDESLSGGLGVYDGDIRKRAVKYGLNMGHTLYADAPVLHQWHPKSPLKHHNRPKRDDNPPVVKNLGRWGELP